MIVSTCVPLAFTRRKIYVMRVEAMQLVTMPRLKTIAFVARVHMSDLTMIRPLYDSNMTHINPTIGILIVKS